MLELVSGDKGLMQASREPGAKDTVLSSWKQEFVGNAASCLSRRKQRKTGIDGSPNGSA